MIEYSDQEFEKKLMLLKDTQEAIQTLSTWCLKRHEHHKSIISNWLKAIRKVKIEKRLTLFYLANDVIQYSKKKNYKFVDGWATVIQKAIPYVRDEKIQKKITRIINIWKERGVYDDTYLADLTGLLTTPIQKLKLADPVQEFQIQPLAVKIRSCVKLEQLTDLKMKTLKETNLPLTNNESIQNMLKDRNRSHEFLNELNDGIVKIESYIKCLKKETIDRAQLIDALEVATSYYDEQNEEVKTVAQAYFNYSKRVRQLLSKLETLINSLPTDSPMPSPDINAPSPSSSSVSIEDINMPNFNIENISNASDFLINNSSSIENNDNEIYVPTINSDSIKSYVPSETYNNVQDVYDPAAMNFPVMENKDLQDGSQFTYDAPSPPPDETFAFPSFAESTNLGYSNRPDDQTIKKSAYAMDNYHEAYVPTPISSQAYMNTEYNNMVSDNNLSLVANDKTMPLRQDQTLGLVISSDHETWPVMTSKFTSWDTSVQNSWSSQDTPASPPYHEKVSYHDTPIISKTSGGPIADHCVQVSKMTDRDDRILPSNMINENADIDHRNLISLTNSPYMSSPVVSTDVDYRTLPGIPMPPSPPAMLMAAVNKPPKDNVESVDMDLSDDDDRPKANHEQTTNPMILPPPPPPPPMVFDFETQLADVSKQWEQTSQQQWTNETANYNDGQTWNVEPVGVDQWKPQNQWKQSEQQSGDSIGYNQKQPAHNQWEQQPENQWQSQTNHSRDQPRNDFRPKWNRGNGNNSWPRGPRNFSQRSRTGGRWNHGPRFGPRNQQPW
ncbi:uncharacterized protein LOC126846907 isoform X2 [Adelges cooleyi]|uniref:uncharacterized protein LOC126846907 isoform X2 n=1 Tax=Adelges cooleyi TaxID=133065 RepID=UPI0021807041|nr:uncharacterized protein LOC126846907 isoform X2 [Adelges cooleyi]